MDKPYCLTYKTQFAERLTKGFVRGNYSDDGDWVVSTKTYPDRNEWCNARPEKLPQYIKTIMAKHNHDITKCCMTIELSTEIVEKFNTVDGGSDGYHNIEPEDG